MSSQRDLLGAIEVAYDLECSDERWLRRLARAALAGLGRGLGVVAYTYEASEPTRYRVASVGARRNWRRAAAALLATLDPASIQRRFGHATYFVASRRFRDDRELASAFETRLAPLGIRDVAGVVAQDPGGSGLLVCFASAAAIEPDAREVATWSRIAAHWAAGHRLRRQLAVLPTRGLFDGAEAILSPSGELHLGDEAVRAQASRIALRQAALAIDRARRAAGRGDAEEAVEMWQALVEGRWSLLDHFDHHGRYFLIARKNDPAVAPHAGLSLRERQVATYASLGHSNKLIAYELGLRGSTVATHLAQATRKLGLASRQALIVYWSGSRNQASVSRFDVGGGEHAVVGLEGTPLPRSLTPTEREVVELALSGVSNAAIARRLQISPRTVANELARSYRKLGVGSRAQLAARFGARPL
jgi:DNA-binding CsgD family transcriptional regulator